MKNLLQIEKATKRFQAPEGGLITALDNVSLTITHNEFLTLLGPSGCGKTTLLRAISGFEDLDSGEIYIDGEAMGTRAAHRRPVNTVFQKYALFPHLNVSRNVAYSMEVAGLEKREVTERVGKILELVGLVGMGERKISQLSGGQQQRVALARSLVAQPKILLLDEPLSALDKNLRHKMQQELKSLQHELGISFVFVTHDQEEALVMSDRIAVLNDGLIQQLDKPEALYHRPKNEFVARFIGESNLFPGRVLSSTQAGLKIKLAGGDTIAVASSKCPAGTEVKVLIRPEKVTLAKGKASDGLKVSGHVLEHYFVGTDYQLVVAVEGLGRVKATVRNPANDAVQTDGSRITLFLPHEAMHVIPVSGMGS
ncbi:ABC transporter ATP-binding protein [Salaquimonas pukyongi]|uniref:ABC transporter ATP-binding protein n=1 Tax=Salaquimonas pukyongi TaxID=2712698 RepID=UPI00096B9F9D|nr:ABC transporter ATP-binding protein [Salaquimonas pukyongi]